MILQDNTLEVMTPRPLGGKGDDRHDDEARRRQAAFEREVAHYRVIYLNIPSFYIA